MAANSIPVERPAPGIYLVRPGVLLRFWKSLGRTFVATYEDNCFSIAKGVAYSGLLAFFPVLTSLAAILVQANADSVSRLISDFLFEVVPPGSEELVRYEFTVRGQRPGWLIVIASVLSIWAASGAITSLMEGFQAAYRLPTGRPMVRQRAVAILLVFGAAVPALGATVLILLGAWTEQTFFQLVGITSPGDPLIGSVALLGRISRYVIALGTLIVVAGVVYYFGPNRPMRLRTVWPGAVLATVLWMIATSGFGWYVRHIAHYNIAYGTIGAALALLIWMYLIGIIALFGCEYNAERERLGIA